MEYSEIVKCIDALLADLLDDDDSGDLESLLVKLDCLLDTKEQIIDGYAISFLRLQQEIEAEKAKLKTLSEKYKKRIATLSSQYQRLQEHLLLKYQQGCMGKKNKGKMHTIGFKSYPKCVCLVEPKDLPPEYQRVKIEADNSSLRKGIKSGSITGDIAYMDENIKPVIN